MNRKSATSKKVAKRTKPYPESSACTRAKGFAMLGDAGPVLDGAVAALPPPPRSGFAIRPKLNGDAEAAFWAERVGEAFVSRSPDVKYN